VNLPVSALNLPDFQRASGRVFFSETLVFLPQRPALNAVNAY
jgi:hypothetical protein